MKEYIKHIPLGLFIAFTIKILNNGVTPEEAFSLAVLAGLSAYFVNRSENEELKNINSKIETLEKDLVKKEKQIEELRSHVSTIKLGQQVRSVAKF